MGSFWVHLGSIWGPRTDLGHRRDRGIRVFKTIALYNENVHDRVSRAGETHVFSPSAVNTNKNDEGQSLQGG